MIASCRRRVKAYDLPGRPARRRRVRVDAARTPTAVAPHVDKPAPKRVAFAADPSAKAPPARARSSSAMRLELATRLSFSLLLLACAGVTSSSRSAPLQTRKGTKAADLVALPVQEATRHLPVRLRGVVTFFDPEAGVLFVQDDGGGALVDTSGVALELRPGLAVEVEGASDIRGGTPLVVRPRVKVVGEAPLPPPRRV